MNANRTFRLMLCTFVAVLAASSLARGENWPQWRGEKLTVADFARLAIALDGPAD